MSSSYSQDSKVYFGASMGYTYPGGDFSSSQDLKQGIHFGLMDAGYRFSEKYGAAINFSASLQISEKYEEDVFFTLPTPDEAKNLLKKYSHKLNSEELQVLNEIVEIQRKKNPVYGH